MLHYYPQHVSSINMPIFRRTNFIHTASGIVAMMHGRKKHQIKMYLLGLLSVGWMDLAQGKVQWLVF